MGWIGWGIINNCFNYKEWQDKNKEVIMKFLIGVLVIRFMVEVMNRKENKGNVQKKKDKEQQRPSSCRIWIALIE